MLKGDDLTLKNKIKTFNKESQTTAGNIEDIFQNIAILISQNNDDEPEDEEEAMSDKQKQHKKLKAHYDKEDDQYYKEMPRKKRKLIDNIEKRIYDINNIKVPLRFKILDSNMDIKLKALALHKVDQLSEMRTSDNEYFKLKNYIECLSKIPIGKYKNLPVARNNSLNKIKTFLNNIKAKFDNTVFGHEETKQQIIRLLAKWISNPKAGGLVIGLQGAPGTAKTLFASTIAENLQMPMSFISLGTCSSSTDVVGSNYVYEGSRYGKLVAEIMKAEVMNPIIFFDELDKISPTKYGDEITNALIHLTDSTQNMKFHDRYFSDVDLDFSKSLMIFSYNSEEKVNPILKDRMVTINVSGYNSADKTRIAKNYLLPKIYTEYGFKNDDLVFTDDIIKQIIHRVNEEEGVRCLKRGLEDIISQINLNKILKTDNITFPLTVSDVMIEKYLKKKKDSSKIPSMYF